MPDSTAGKPSTGSVRLMPGRELAAGLCSHCAAGRHQHDRYTGTMAGTQAGEDAGCPSVARDGNECRCAVRLPLVAVFAPHCPTCRCDGRTRP